MRAVLGGWQLPNMSSRWVMGAGTHLLSEEALEDGACRAIGRKMSFFTAEEAAWWAAIYLPAGKAGKVYFIPIVMVEVTHRCGRWGLGWGSSRSSRCTGGSNSRSGWRDGFMGSDLFMYVFQILFHDPNLLLH